MKHGGLILGLREKSRSTAGLFRKMAGRIVEEWWRSHDAHTLNLEEGARYVAGR